MPGSPRAQQQQQMVSVKPEPRYQDMMLMPQSQQQNNQQNNQQQQQAQQFTRVNIPQEIRAAGLTIRGKYPYLSPLLTPLYSSRY